jgi:tetratricopeptide (TPR) repeat protein
MLDMRVFGYRERYRSRLGLIFAITVWLGCWGRVAVAQGPVTSLPSDLLLKELDAQAAQMIEAQDVLSLYEEFVKEFEPGGELLKRIESRMEKLKASAEAGHVRLGAKWVSTDEADEARQKERQLLDRAKGLLDADQGAAARDALLEASRKNPDGVVADFVLGLIYATVVFDHDKAEEHFKKVLTRQPGSASALINLAVIEIKSKNWLSALNHLRTATLTSLNRAEIVQNVGRVVAAGNQKKLRIEATHLNKFIKLAEELKATDPQLKFDPRTGWLYAPLLEGADSVEQPDSPVNGDDPVASPEQVDFSNLLLRGRSIGFCVAPGLIVSHRDVARLDVGQTPAAFGILWRDESGKNQIHGAKLRGASPWLGVALLHSPDCRAIPMPLSSEKVPAGTMVIAGKSEMGRGTGVLSIGALETNIRSTRSTAMGPAYRLEPVPTVAALGAPLVGADGKVLGLVAGFAPPGEKATTPWGLPASHIAKYLKEVSEELKPSPLTSSGTAPLKGEFLGGRAVLIEAYAREAEFDYLSLKGLTPGRRRTDLSIEDRSCTWCGGSGRVDCDNMKCRQGAVDVRVPVDTVEGIGGNQRVVRRFQTVKEPCVTCGASGFSPCRICSASGVDPNVK